MYFSLQIKEFVFLFVYFWPVRYNFFSKVKHIKNFSINSFLLFWGVNFNFDSISFSCMSVFFFLSFQNELVCCLCVWCVCASFIRNFLDRVGVQSETLNIWWWFIIFVIIYVNRNVLILVKFIQNILRFFENFDQRQLWKELMRKTNSG